MSRTTLDQVLRRLRVEGRIVRWSLADNAAIDLDAGERGNPSGPERIASWFLPAAQLDEWGPRAVELYRAHRPPFCSAATVFYRDVQRVRAIIKACEISDIDPVVMAMRDASLAAIDAALADFRAAVRSAARAEAPARRAAAA
jgi:hypothetical protein